MCGIAGIVKLKDNTFQITDSLLKKMSDVIVHRGPDSEGRWISHDRRCGFSFRRLAIIDLSANGNQPMHDTDGRFTIVFNGEIYNHRDLRKQLEQKGYKYKSNTDTETILYGYREWGEKLLTKMIGMWSFAIWDNQTGELFAARDRIGIKPFYYLVHNSNFLFASEIKSILEYEQYHREINLEQLPFYLYFGATNNNSTLFRNIKKLAAAHYLKIDKNGQVKVKRYWDPFATLIPYSSWTEEQITTEIITLLRDSVKIRMMSDVPFGVFLSGGIDSSLNVALMTEFMDRPVDTFTVGFRDLEKYNELGYARQISKLFNTNHREIIIDWKMALERIHKIAWHLDEPNADPVCIPINFLSELTRNEGTIVVLVGEGSDEQFIGYNWMLREIKVNKNLWKYYQILPKSIRKLIFSILKYPLTKSKQYQVLEYFLKSANEWPQYWSGMPFFTSTEITNLIGHNKNSYLDFIGFYADKMFILPDFFDLEVEFSQKAIFTEFYQRLPEMLLMRVDKMGMAHSIEPRVPFLDHRIVELSFSLDFKKKIPDGKTTKYLLKKAAKGFIPDQIINRPKQGFAAPVSEWIRNEWFDFVKDTILSSRLIYDGVINPNPINEMMTLHKEKRVDFYKQIYSLLMLSLWYEEYF